MSNFTKNDEEFICENCGKQIPVLGYTSRDHCNHCLYSKHVDKNPGDRAEKCQGKLIPIAVQSDAKKGYVIIYRCEKDDNEKQLIQLSGNPIPIK